MTVHEAVAIMPCDNCGADTETRTTQTIYSSDLTSTEWDCGNCGHPHRIEHIPGDDN